MRLTVALAVLFTLGPVNVHAGMFPDKYDGLIKDGWALYHPGDDWRWHKAQLWQESHLDPTAVSPAGAVGIAQFMRGTGIQYGLIDRQLVAPSILASARLMRDNVRFWKSKRPVQARRFLALAGYNCGNGNLVKAQKLCGGKRLYAKIVRCLPRVTGRYAKETLGYAPKIAKWRGMML
jgi:membrane-bound lytic murein transglycosylase MltF